VLVLVVVWLRSFAFVLHGSYLLFSWRFSLAPSEGVGPTDSAGRTSAQDGTPERRGHSQRSRVWPSAGCARPSPTSSHRPYKLPNEGFAHIRPLTEVERPYPSAMFMDRATWNPGEQRSSRVSDWTSKNEGRERRPFPYPPTLGSSKRRKGLNRREEPAATADDP
jgi:hypothetical protein